MLAKGSGKLQELILTVGMNELCLVYYELLFLQGVLKQ